MVQRDGVESDDEGEQEQGDEEDEDEDEDEEGAVAAGWAGGEGRRAQAGRCQAHGGRQWSTVVA